MTDYLCKLGLHVWKYSLLKEFVTRVHWNPGFHDSYEEDLISKDFSIRECTFCGQVQEVVSWHHSRFLNKLKLKWKRTK